MPIRLSPDEAAFLERVRGYCRSGHTQPEMAEAETLSLTGFRQKLGRCGFEITAETRREVVRLKTGETFADLDERGEIVVETAQPVAA